MSKMEDLYDKFLISKTQLGSFDGFDPLYLHESMFDFQSSLVDWSLRKGRSAIFADCGLGKTLMELVWGDNVVRKTNKRVLLLTPPAVAYQTVSEAEKFGIECNRSESGKLYDGINVANYERLHYFNASDFVGVIGDESSILKSYDGARRGQITEFMRTMPYRLLATATAAPNDYIELGTSSEALGELGYMDMLNRFFVNDLNNAAVGRAWGMMPKWRFKGHAELPFWKWVCSWARAVRMPSDIGFEDGKFVLPPLEEKEHILEYERVSKGHLIPTIAIGLKEQREELRHTIKARCDKAASLVNNTKEPAMVWCHLNDEGDLLEKLIPDSVQVSGKDSDKSKEDKFMAFAKGDVRVLVTKPKIGAWGLNFQHCAHVVVFPSHSFEQYYQAVRRCWRFGQTRKVRVDIVTTRGGGSVLKNLQRKSAQADGMFKNLVREMSNASRINRGVSFTKEQELPKWL